MKSVYLHLYHGRHDPGETLHDWGEDGPCFALEWLSVTYLAEIRFATEEGDEGELPFVEDLVYYDGMYYGDWSVTAVKPLGAKLADYNPKLAKHKKSKMQYTAAKAADDPAGK